MMTRPVSVRFLPHRYFVDPPGETASVQVLAFFRATLMITVPPPGPSVRALTLARLITGRFGGAGRLATADGAIAASPTSMSVIAEKVLRIRESP
jgi:hypothetical protein